MKKFLLFVLLLIGDCTIAFAQHQIPMQIINICVASANDMGDSYYDIRNGTSASFSNLTDEYSICVTKKGYIPYIAKCGNTVYMQNESINRDYEVFSNQTIAGSNVTTNVSSGPVTINKGKTTIKGINGVTINDSFEVKNGASIEIRAN